MNKVGKVAPLVVLCMFIVAVPSLWAHWIPDGVPLCTATSNQYSAAITSDNAGGSVIAWTDSRNGNEDIYAQRVDASGIVLWTEDGVAICVAGGDQHVPRITSDGAGGAVVTWEDNRSGNDDVYSQRVGASGDIEWAANGVAICTATGLQWYPQITSDGVGGAVIAWTDYRSGNMDIYAQRVSASGTILWTPDGVAICTAAGNQGFPDVVSDGVGGAILAWHDSRSGNMDVYAQRVDASGWYRWATDGVSLCTATGDQFNARIASDGAGGAIVAWTDYRSGSDCDIYVQRVNVSGTVLWTNNGVAISAASGNQDMPQITSDGAGGTIISWTDNRSGNMDIYAQRVNVSGTIQWTISGVALCTAAETQHYGQITSDGAHGAIVTWQDCRRSWDNYDIYAQRVNAAGVVQWTSNGVVLCSALGDQLYTEVISDGSCGAIVTWQDKRSGNGDIYAQFIDGQGRTGYLAPEIFSVRDVPGDEGGKVYLSWYAARPDVFMDPQMSHYTLWRAISPTLAAQAVERGALSIEDLSELEATSGKPVIYIEHLGTLTYFWELMETVEALYMEAYGKPVATLFDSTAVCNEYHYFQVVAHTTDPRVFWKSEPDSGYSVDNLPPEEPIGLAGEQSFVPVGLHLTWNVNQENDLSHYSVYRGLNENFVPTPGNRVATSTEPDWFDSSWRWDSGYYYKVSATDVHDNQSGFALLRPDNVTGTETPKAPDASYLTQNYPNPFNPTTRIAFGLSAQGNVSLRIYDVSGKLLRVLVSNDRRAGRYEETWDGRDSNGRTVSSGIYFYRLDAGAFSETKKMALTR